MNLNRKITSLLLAICLIAFSFAGCKRTPGDNTSSSFISSVISSLPEVSSEPSEPPEPVDNGIRLVMSSPAKTTTYVTASDFSFGGTSDPAEALTVNGNPIERNPDGTFSYQVKLNVGKNTFSFLHKGETKIYTVNYRYVLIESFSPTGKQTYPSGSTIVVNAKARKGSQVTSVFNGTTITLTRTNESDETDFVEYNGIFKLPKDNINDLNLGKITFKATYSGMKETFTSGNITCSKSDIIVNFDPTATPKGGRYMNVGSGYIAEIVEYNAETFNGVVTNADLKTGSVDWSRPTNNYLPKGTLDYCSTSYINYKEINYVTLRAGYRVYKERQDKPRPGKKPVVKQYLGELPDHNEITFATLETTETHTVMTFDCLWKAPFYFDLLPQSYTNPSKQDYTLSNVTYGYVDISFCYATLFTGEVTIPEDNPLFKSAAVIENKDAEKTVTLRLYLKKTGAFYGWDSYYNANNQLCFEFLNPRVIEAGENEYGVNLKGAKILIDVGHGGTDCGAPGLDVKNHSEAVQNLFLAQKIKAELEKIGAVVTLTRTGNTTSSSDDKITLLKRIKPDFCIAIHHDSASSSSANGYSAFYHHPFSKKATEFIYKQTENGVGAMYKKYKLGWHVYFVARVTNCPVVLTENGFMSSPYDYNNIVSDASNTKKAKAAVRGIVDYFNSIQ